MLPEPNIRLSKLKQVLQLPRPILFVAAFATLGVILLIASRAATPFASIEPEQGIKTANLVTINDSNASNESAVQFNSPSNTAPNTQGTWTSPEGAVINVNSAGVNPATSKPWVIADIYKLFTENATASGDLSVIAPNLTIKVQDIDASHVSTSTANDPQNGYTKVTITLLLKGINSTFSVAPDAQFAHEYGHAWSFYYFYLAENADWKPYLNARWTTSDGSKTLATDTRTDSSYIWAPAEIIADDYRMLFGSTNNLIQRPNHMNTEIPPPANVPGLREFLLGPFRVR